MDVAREAVEALGGANCIAKQVLSKLRAVLEERKDPLPVGFGSDPVESLRSLTRTALLRLFYLYDIAIDEVLPCELNEDQLLKWEAFMVQSGDAGAVACGANCVDRRATIPMYIRLEALRAMCMKAEPYPPQKVERIKALRQQFRTAFA